MVLKLCVLSTNPRATASCMTIFGFEFDGVAWKSHEYHVNPVHLLVWARVDSMPCLAHRRPIVYRCITWHLHVYADLGQGRMVLVSDRRLSDIQHDVSLC